MKIMRIPINWKSPPQKGHREPTPWGIPGLLKKGSPNMGTKTFLMTQVILNDFHIEKRIPKHGDENPVML